MTPEQQQAFNELGLPKILSNLRQDMWYFCNSHTAAVSLIEEAMQPEFGKCPIDHASWVRCAEAVVNRESNRTVNTVRQAFDKAREALASVLCAEEPECPTQRESRRLCVEAIQALNKLTELNAN